MRIFVFGSNESGIHGAGAALNALESYGAKQGIGFGPQGRSFAIPTKSWGLKRTLKIDEIEFYVDRFIEYARFHPEHEFQVTQIGCGLAGWSAGRIVPLFATAPPNCLFDEAWKPLFEIYEKQFKLEQRKYWGTF